MPGVAIPAYSHIHHQMPIVRSLSARFLIFQQGFRMRCVYGSELSSRPLRRLSDRDSLI
jgi:hypothetical protein